MATGKNVAVETGNDVCTLSVGSDEVYFHICHGPEKLPSEYLEHLQREGWVCLNSILQPEIVERLERVSCTGPYEHMEQNMDIPKICQDAAVCRAVAEPISLWVLREYLQTRDIHLGHPPGFNVLKPETLAQAGRRWHSDIPYIPSTSPQPVFPRKGPPKACNRNTCVSDFTHQNGATMFKPGSHRVDSGPRKNGTELCRMMNCLTADQRPRFSRLPVAVCFYMTREPGTVPASIAVNINGQ